jgi:hypothetical protein
MVALIGGAVAVALLVVPVAGIASALPVMWLFLLLLLIAVVLTLHVRQTLLRDANSVLAFYLLELDLPIEAMAEISSDEKRPRPLQGMRLRLRASAVDNLGSDNETRQETRMQARIQANGFVTPWFTAIPYCLETDPAWRKWWPRILAIWPDGIDGEVTVSGLAVTL